MSLPVIASQISLAVGLWMVLSVFWKRRQEALKLEVVEIHAQERFLDFLHNQGKKIHAKSARYRTIFRRLYLQLAQHGLHYIRIMALKLEAASAKWLHQVRVKHTIKPNQTVPQEPVKTNGEGNGQPINGNGNFFSILKESSSHETVEAKLEELKGEKPGSETSAEV